MQIPSDQKLAEEFRKNPCGAHSEELKRLLERFRGGAMPGKYVLIEREPHGAVQVGRLGETRGAAIELIDGAIFDSVADAEWYVFKQRWKLHFGQALPE